MLRLDLISPVADPEREHIRPRQHRIDLNLAPIEPARPAALDSVQLKSIAFTIDSDVVKHKSSCQLPVVVASAQSLATTGTLPSGGRHGLHCRSAVSAVSGCRAGNSEHGEDSGSDGRHLRRPRIDLLPWFLFQHPVEEADRKSVV